MNEILLAIAFFAVVMWFVNVPLRKREVHYHTHVWTNALLFSTATTTLLLLTGNLERLLFENSPGALVLIGGMYVGLSAFWQTHAHNKVHVLRHVPTPSYQTMLTPDARSGITKTFEVFFQDVVAAVIVWSLIASGYSFWETVAVFGVISFVVHIPGVWLMGRFFGLYFLITATLLVPLAVWFFTFTHSGFIALFALHLLTYVCLYVYLWRLIRHVNSETTIAT